MTHPQPEGFLAFPPSGKGRGVLVLHAWWGLNDTMRAFCTRQAESGYVAFAPDLYNGKIAKAEILGKAYNPAVASLAWDRTLAFLNHSDS